MDQWEYRVENFPLKAKGLGARGIGKVDELQAELNELGREGWELVSLLSPTIAGTGFGFVAALKRRM
jgi:hypothetical protein